MDERSRHRQFEDQFLGQLRARAEALTGRALPADRLAFEALPDGDDTVRDQLSRLGMYDRAVREELPGRQALQVRFLRPAWGGLTRRTVVRLRAQVLTQTEALVQGTPPGPVGREQVLDALARYDVLPRAQQPTAVVLASPTGFAPEARALVDRPGPPTLILMGGREDGGWEPVLPRAVQVTPWAKLFELETLDAQLRRLQRHLASLGAELDARGVALPRLAEQLGLPARQVETLVRQAGRLDPRLLLVVYAGTLHVCRTPLADRGAAMTIWNRLRRWFGRGPTVAERVRELAAQRVRLEAQRHELDEQVDGLERQERELLQQGAQAAGPAEKKQVAGKLIRLRRELQRQRTRAQVFTQQIDVLGTQMHHLTIAAQSREVALPSAAELTQQAAEAEQAITELSANADLAAQIEVGAGSPQQAAEEAAILAEFAQLAGDGAAAPGAAAKDEDEAAPPAASRPAQADARARPELG
jgi:hypothetical protein